MSAPLCSEKDIQRALVELAGWSLQSNKLHYHRRFSDFAEAFAFMTQVALIAERMDHHPDWKNVYNQLWIELFTHDSGGITEKDLLLAKEISKLS